MGWIILSTILFIVAFIGLGVTVTPAKDRYADPTIGWKLQARQAFALLAGIFVLIGCFKTVPTGSTGIVTTFGRVEPYTLDAGVHFMAPWQKVIKMDNRTQKAQIELGCFSSDIQEVHVFYTINYQINKQNAQEIYRTIGTDYYNTVITPRCQEAVKAAFARYTAENLIADRNTVATLIEEDLRNDLANYNIELVATAIEDIDFSDEFTNAAEAKVTAQQNKLTAQTQQETANLEAQAAAERQVIQAQADADSAIIAAQGDAEVAQIAADSAEYQGQKDAAIMSNLGKMLQQYPELIDYYKATGWDGKLPETMLGDDVNYFIGQ